MTYRLTTKMTIIILIKRKIVCSEATVILCVILDATFYIFGTFLDEEFSIPMDVLPRVKTAFIK